MIEREVANQKTGWNEAHVNVDSKFKKKMTWCQKRWVDLEGKNEKFGCWRKGRIDGQGWKKRRDCLIMCYCLSRYSYGALQILRYWQSPTCVHVCVPFYAFPYNPGCKWSLWEQRMRPLPSISLIKTKLLSPSRSLSLFISCSFYPVFPLSLRVKRVTCHYQSTPSFTARV